MALILSQSPLRTRWTAEDILKSSCDKVGGYDYDVNTAHGTWSEELGHGRVNAMAALELNAFTSVTETERASQFDLWQNLNGEVTLYADLDVSESMQVVLIGTDGRIAADLGHFNLSSGKNKVRLSMPDVGAGIYLLRVSTATSSISFKLIR